MFILNAGLSHKSKDWLMNSTTEICEDKERVKLRKEMLVQSKLFCIWVISRVLDVQMISNFYTNFVRHRQQWRSPNLSCSPNTVQYLAHIWSSKSPNDLYFFFLESWVNCLQLSCLPEDPVQMVAFLFYSDKKIRIFTKSKVGHPLNN